MFSHCARSSRYHATVGRNGVLELDFAINRDGLVEPSHAARYKDLGDWARACYPDSEEATDGSGLAGELVNASCAAQGCVLELDLSAPATVDRVMIREDLATGQRIRSFTVEAATAESPDQWHSFTSGKSVGNKRIALVDGGAPVVNASKLRLTVPAYAGSDSALTVARFAAFRPCPSA